MDAEAQCESLLHGVKPPIQDAFKGKMDEK